jgi:hypothetical protein
VSAVTFGMNRREPLSYLPDSHQLRPAGVALVDVRRQTLVLG